MRFAILAIIQQVNNMPGILHSLHFYFFGHPPPRCSELLPGESCHKHDSVPPGMKLVAGILAPAFARGYSILSSGLPNQIELAQERAGYGLEVAFAVLFLLWCLSLFWTTHQKFLSPLGYIAAGVAAPFTLLSIITPLIAVNF